MSLSRNWGSRRAGGGKALGWAVGEGQPNFSRLNTVPLQAVVCSRGAPDESKCLWHGSEVSVGPALGGQQAWEHPARPLATVRTVTLGPFRVLAEGSPGHTLWWVGAHQDFSLSPNDKVINSRAQGSHLCDQLSDPAMTWKPRNTRTPGSGHNSPVGSWPMPCTGVKQNTIRCTLITPPPHFQILPKIKCSP